MNINENELAQSLKHINLEPWHDGRSILDGKRPIEQHIMMVINSLKAERDAALDKLACRSNPDWHKGAKSEGGIGVTGWD